MKKKLNILKNRKFGVAFRLNIISILNQNKVKKINILDENIVVRFGHKKVSLQQILWKKNCKS